MHRAFSYFLITLFRYTAKAMTADSTSVTQKACQTPVGPSWRQSSHASYVVVLGIYYKLQTFLYLPASGIVQGMRPLIGYNYGAKEHARVAKLYQLTLGMSAVIMAAGTVICMAASAPLIGLFSSNRQPTALP